MSERIESMFKDYQRKKRDLELLRKRLRSMVEVSADDVILSMVFSSPDGEHVQSSGTSDKTATIAMHYREEQERLSKDMVGPITRQICRLENELRLFDYCVALLPGRLPDVIRCLVENEDNWETTMRKLDISKRTLQRDRRKAINKLEEMYQLFDALPQGTVETEPGDV